MECHEVQREMAALSAAERASWKARHLNRHLRRCPSCAIALERQRQLERQVSQWLDDPPPAALRGRIMAAHVAREGAAAQLAPVVDDRGTWRALAQTVGYLKENSTMRRRLSLALAVPVAVALLAVSLINNDAASAELSRMQAAVGRARSVRALYSTVDADGSLHPHRRLWYQDGRWRLEEDRRPALLYTNGKLWRFDPAQGKAVKAPGSFPPIPAELQRWAASGFLFTDLMREMGRTRWRDRIHRLNNATVDGRAVRRFVIEAGDDAPEPTRLLFTVDDPTDLPLRVEKQHVIRGRWSPCVVVEFQFNQRLPEHIFDPDSLAREAFR